MAIIFRTSHESLVTGASFTMARIGKFFAAIGVAIFAAFPTWGQDYPKSPITLVIPLAPGDGADIAGRAMGEELSRLLNVPVVAVNRPGAGGSLGTDGVVKAAKDGYTLLFAQNSALTLRRVLEPQGVAYDPVTDLTSLGLGMRSPSLLVVRGDASFRNFGEFVEFAKKNPGQLRIGTAGPGSVGDFCVEIIKAQTGADITMVPFKGASPAVTALRGGHIEAVVLALGVLSSHLKSGAFKGLVTSHKFSEFAEIPTMTELGYKQNLLGVWLAFFAPSGLPADVTRALVPAIEKAVKNEAVAAKLMPLGIAAQYVAPHALTAEIREEHRMVEELARRAGLIK